MEKGTEWLLFIAEARLFPPKRSCTARLQKGNSSVSGDLLLSRDLLWSCNVRILLLTREQLKDQKTPAFDKRTTLGLKEKP